jgi:hypothetical protein
MATLTDAALVREALDRLEKALHLREDEIRASNG